MQKEKNSHGLFFEAFSKLSNINPRFHRISSMLLDHMIMTLVLVPPLILTTFLQFKFEAKSINDLTGFLFFLSFFLYLNKDLYRGKSPAKRIMGYQVVNKKTGAVANELQCFVRNLTICIAWPLEVVIGFINPERRIGDFIANTMVVSSHKEKARTIWFDLKNTKFGSYHLWIIALGFVYFYLLAKFMPGWH